MVSYKILLSSDSTFFKLFFHIFATIIEAFTVAGHTFLCTLIIQCGMTADNFIESLKSEESEETDQKL